MVHNSGRGWLRGKSYIEFYISCPRGTNKKKKKRKICVNPTLALRSTPGDPCDNDYDFLRTRVFVERG